MTSPTTLYSFDTQYSADSCEYNAALGVLATGTYQVNKLDPESESPETERLGRIYLHRVSHDPEFTCNKLHETETPAVLDMKWNPKEPVLATVNASGQLVTFRYSSDQDEFQKISSEQISEGLALALEWHKSSDRIIVSDSKGKIHLIDHEHSNKVIHEFPRHGYEAWTCCFSAWDENLVFSGGDDCSFNCYDLRMQGIARKNSKIHTMGVTAMISDRTTENQIITGSYDESLRWWDERNLRSPVNSVEVGGGVWRIKQRAQNLLIGAMHGGFLILDGTEIVSRYTEHESLAYGADWINECTAATCSFYDHVLKIWTF